MDRKITSVMAVSLLAPLFTVGPAAARAHSTDPWDWILQHVCADASDRPVPADPYDGCPNGTHERPLKLGDPMPYLRHDQPAPGHPDGFQRHDSYPLVDRHFGGVVSASDFDFDYHEPYGAMHPGDGDGYDVYRVSDGYVSGSGTRDAGGYRQTFFGPGCRPYNGWVFFPVVFLHGLSPGASGRGVFPIHGDYYEQNGEPYPGRCGPDTHLNTGTLTTWSFEAGFVFGGVNGALEKRIDTIVSTHGFPVSASPHAHIGLERFYFTDLYGLTRWEVWKLAADSPKAPAGTCRGPTEMDYRGVAFKLAQCRDWSAIDVFGRPNPRLPWPYPEANLLMDQHFDEPGAPSWQGAAAVSGGPAHLNRRQFQSRTAIDTRLSHNKEGVHYMQINCGGLQCNPEQALFQDVPINRVKDGQSIDYGFSGVVEGNKGGVMHVELSQRDSAGRAVWSTSFDVNLPTEASGVKPDEFIYRASSVFLMTSPPLRLAPGTVSIRLSLSPRAPVLYDILDAWVMPR